MKKYILNPYSMFFIGGILGLISKRLDIYDTMHGVHFSLGYVLSEMSIWILFGVLISIYSETKKKAMINILPFCIGMLLTYYITAEITNSIYGWKYIKGWFCFSLCSPIMAYFTWMTKEKGIFPKLLSIGIIIFTLLISIRFFGGPGWHDILIIMLLIYILFFKKIRIE